MDNETRHCAVRSKCIPVYGQWNTTPTENVRKDMAYSSSALSNTVIRDGGRDLFGEAIICVVGLKKATDVLAYQTGTDDLDY